MKSKINAIFAENIKIGTMDLDFEKYKKLQFCDNPTCPMHNKVGENNIKILNSKSQQVYCNLCNNQWVIE